MREVAAAIGIHVQRVLNGLIDAEQLPALNRALWKSAQSRGVKRRLGAPPRLPECTSGSYEATCAYDVALDGRDGRKVAEALCDRSFVAEDAKFAQGPTEIRKRVDVITTT